MHTKVVTMYEIAMLKNIIEGLFMNMVDTRVVKCLIFTGRYMSEVIANINEFVKDKNVKTIESLQHGNVLNSTIVYYYE